jgi:hypothetical protein
VVVTPVPFTSCKKEADQVGMRCKVEYTWRYLPKNASGSECVYVHDKKDARTLVTYWNRSEFWKYKLNSVTLRSK